ncbi:hypothetical protein IU436_20290 [Nocardia farcinica]|uniref:hypothetical protein n=1 Tax=Nocardia farcinica TaxID=37329 RepID=UPI0018956CFD|nr:hypothetical protein [Nocardia farcinica]MBF6420843.1 hypothetical protein [Nocardia farcinica]MBF6432698.1 hypothetical protein [Nocardia farcinica]MBF6503197.1 hypothetical protein [Nocardia farcinica]
MKTQMCPVCRQMVPVQHNGKKPINSDGRTDPWVYEKHTRDDLRGDTVFRIECPASGKNRWAAEYSS